ncbi:MAG: glycoside hydrolase family 88 protein, partial [Prevotella sp.]|nr:glycoside hydrolase family 88 protein [Prevotella sp.]
MLKNLSIFLFFILLSVVCKAEGGEKSFALPAILSSNMVLQQGQPVPVWGKAAPGESIKVV